MFAKIELNNSYIIGFCASMATEVAKWLDKSTFPLLGDKHTWKFNCLKGRSIDFCQSMTWTTTTTTTAATTTMGITSTCQRQWN
jgi:hypothetical protein